MKFESTETRNDLVLNAGEKTIQAVRFLTGFAHDDFIAGDNVLIVWLQETLPKKRPVKGLPRQDAMIQPLNGAITAAFLGPA